VLFTWRYSTICTGEEFFDDRLELSIAYVLLGQKAAATRVGFHGARASAQLLWETAILRVAWTIVRMNVNRARLRQRLQASEAIVGEKDPARLPWRSDAETMTARRCVGGEFRVRGETVNRRPHGRANLLCDFGYDANRQHDLFPHVFSRIQSCN
jgi:hypothetical protein